jgi:hypothetical protein
MIALQSQQHICSQAEQHLTTVWPKTTQVKREAAEISSNDSQHQEEKLLRKSLNTKEKARRISEMMTTRPTD